MGSGEQDLRLNVKAEGTEQAAGKVGKVTEATEELQGKTKNSAAAMTA